MQYTDRTESVLCNRSNKSMTWAAQFYGELGVLEIEGKSLAAEKGTDATGAVFDYVDVAVGPHESKSVRAKQSP